MHTTQVILQCAVALGLLNVWLLRAKQSTPYRGGNAQTMREEFAAYGLPPLAMYLVGTLKVGAALCLIAGVWWPSLVFPAALLIAILMVGAVAMHVKIQDPARKSVPAALLLLICAVICFLDRR
ncbi:MAG: DoxX family protein [Acidobacteriota bacterium]|nr:DoxX family protein [Acidobacteriota bacterium]